MSNFSGGKDPFYDPFSGIFSGKDPFDDPVFTNPFDYQSGPKKEKTIDELKTEDYETQKNSLPNKELVLQNPNSEINGVPCFSFQRVTYGGINGTYYTSSIFKKIGSDGMVLMEINEEDKIINQTLSTISKGIHDKGLSVTTKHNSDGSVDSIQTLHNLYEDELAGFEETWKENMDKNLPGSSDVFNLLEDAGSMNRSWVRPYEEDSGDDLQQKTVNPGLFLQLRDLKISFESISTN